MFLLWWTIFNLLPLRGCRVTAAGKLRICLNDIVATRVINSLRLRLCPSCTYVPGRGSPAGQSVLKTLHGYLASAS